MGFTHRCYIIALSGLSRGMLFVDGLHPSLLYYRPFRALPWNVICRWAITHRCYISAYSWLHRNLKIFSIFLRSMAICFSLRTFFIFHQTFPYLYSDRIIVHFLNALFYVIPSLHIAPRAHCLTRQEYFLFTYLFC